MTLTIREATGADVERLAPRLRAIDVRECAAWGRSAYEGLLYSWSQAALAWTAVEAGEPIAVFGLGAWSLVEGHGFPWLLGSEAVTRRRRELVRLAPAYVAEMRRLCPRLENWVHRDNSASIGWLKRLGFAVEAEARNMAGEPMLRFTMGF